MTETVNLSLQPIPIEIIEESQNVIPVPYKAVQLSSREFITPIEQGTIPINASVRVKFRF